MSDALTRELFPSAQQLISDYEDFVVPQINMGDISGASAYVYGPLKDRFLAHRTAVKNIISLSNRELTRAKSSSLYAHSDSDATVSRCNRFLFSNIYSGTELKVLN
jgi:hypothetical protein